MRRKVEEKRAGRRPRRSFTASFKAEVVALARQGDRTIHATKGVMPLTSC